MNSIFSAPAEPEPPAPRDPLERCPGGVCRHGHGDRCKAALTQHWRYCALTNPGHPHFNQAYLPLIAPEGETSPAVAVAPATPTPSVAAHWLAKACDYLGPICGKGCAGDRRICGAGRGSVSHADCLACVADPTSPGGPIL